MHINHIVMQEDVRNNQYQITHFFLVARQQFIKFLNHTYYISQILSEFEFSKSICFSQNNLINHLSKVFSIRLGEQLLSTTYFANFELKNTLLSRTRPNLTAKFKILIRQGIYQLKNDRAERDWRNSSCFKRRFALVSYLGCAQLSFGKF